MKRLVACLLLAVCLGSAAVAERLEDSTLLSFYDNSILFGDSITCMFRNYVKDLQEKSEQPLLENTKIIGTSNMTLYEGSIFDMSGTLHWSYRGIDTTMYRIVRDTGAAKVFILLGMNDPVGIKIDKALGWVENIIDSMWQVVPSAEVYFFSETPVGTKYCKEKNRPDYPEQVDEYNRLLEAVCEQTGAHYVEISEPLKGEDNHLKPEYCSDEMCHLSPEGMDVWLQCMKDYAQTQYDLGLWDPFTEEPSQSP